MATIIVSGWFDFSQCRNFDSEFKKTPTTVESFVIDLRDAEYLDNSALGMLLGLRDRVGDRKVRIVNANPEIREILRIAYFDRMFAMS